MQKIIILCFVGSILISCSNNQFIDDLFENAVDNATSDLLGIEDNSDKKKVEDNKWPHQPKDLTKY